MAEVEIKPGTRWRHYKGEIYVVLMLGRIEATQEPAVIYQRFAQGTQDDIWVRTVADWHADVPGHGPRFVRAVTRLGP